MKSEIKLVIDGLFFKYSPNGIFSLQIENVHHNFDSALGIYGNSGTGKSTLGRIVADLIKPKSGEVKVEFLHNNGINGRSPSVIYSPQFPERVFLGSQVAETVDYIASMNRDRPDFKAELVALLNSFSVSYPDIKDKGGHEMSGGELRRFALCLVFAFHSDLLILDEPTIGLEGKGVNQLDSAIKRISQDRAVIIISHDIKLVENLCRKVWILRDGRIIFNGSLDKVKTNPEVTKDSGLKYYKYLEKIVEERKKTIFGSS